MSRIIKGDSSHSDGYVQKSPGPAESSTVIITGTGDIATDGFGAGIFIGVHSHSSSNLYDICHMGYLSFDLSTIGNNISSVFLYLKCINLIRNDFAPSFKVYYGTRASLSSLSVSDYANYSTVYSDSIDLNNFSAGNYTGFRLYTEEFKNRPNLNYVELTIVPNIDDAYWIASTHSRINIYNKDSSGNEPYLLINTIAGERKILKGVGRGIY